MKGLLILSHLLILAMVGMTQTVPVKGVVLDKDTKEPLAFCAVVWKNSRAGTLADENGKFSIGRIPNHDTLKVSYVG
ncbi:MAG: hypothetical protein RLY35_2185, partial [Bacteroidota bacterium]